MISEADYKAAVKENNRYQASIGAELANIGISTEAGADFAVSGINEVQKMVSFITSTYGYTMRNKAFLAKMATLAPIDSFFNQVRRRIQVLERPIHSQSNRNRVWRGHSPYSPEQIKKKLQIFRCYRNFVLKGKDGQTPAEKLGIALGPVEIRRILYPRN